MSDIDVYPVMTRPYGPVLRWLALLAVDRSWGARTSVLKPLVGVLWRVSNPRMRWQAEWPGCERAVRALTRAGAYRKAERARS